jgi:hypothetical protein
MPDQQEPMRWCHKCTKMLPETDFPNPKGIVTSVVLDKPRVSMRQLGSVSRMSEVLLKGSVSTMLTILHTG